jgi:hypothetical protein
MQQRLRTATLDARSIVVFTIITAVVVVVVVVVVVIVIAIAIAVAIGVAAAAAVSIVVIVAVTVTFGICQSFDTSDDHGFMETPICNTLL